MSTRRPPPRPKRAGDDFSRAHLPAATINPTGPPSKKARFDNRNPSTLAADDDDEEDAILELDEIGRKGTQTKRNAVELDGYASDSSNENFDARADARAEAVKRGSKAAEEADMFADLEEEEGAEGEQEDLTREGKKKRKAVRFIDADQIEGQVLSSKAGGHVSADFSLNKHVGRERDSSSDEEDGGGDEERDRMEDGLDEELGAGAKKKHAPKLDAFNMRNEEEEGKFDETGNFVRKAMDPFALHDAWLEGSASKADMKRAKEAEDKRDEQRRQRAMADDAVSTGDILTALIVRMEKAETVLEALARLGSAKEKRKPKWQKNKRRNGGEMDVDVDDTAEDKAETRRKEAVEAITAAADQLLTRGQTDVYEAEREVLIRQYRRETGEDWVERVDAESGPIADDRRWEYRWADARDGGEHHGPYDGPTMTAWNDAGYFGEGVEFRQMGGTHGWTDSTEFS